MIFLCLVLPGGKLIMEVHDYNSHEGLRNRNRPRPIWDGGGQASLGSTANQRQNSF